MLVLTTAMMDMAKTSKDELNRLDGAQGDGDLGVTAELVTEAAHQASYEHEDIKSWLIASGNLIRRKAPSTMGILTAMALSAAGRALPDGAMPSSETFLKIQRAMIEDMKARGGAELGDRTVLDAFIPAFEAYQNASEGGKTVKEALACAKNAALDGAKKTKALSPKTGRASWVGDRVVGEIDGGAWFCYMVYQTLHKLS
ncbi:DAK2 domain-containing protein [Alicyclobacillus fastidiosus]|uniref:DAK2 domain-containing protein n=1 Tax=Alicyclobacillus fastidiosus TaxID=392011 RepID=A0ABY6ZI37_9BACL|nr:DAK2 domain-containing protein [Alicyclobacillus fastidiosus]WAH41786.1 DAK2 domain-containing protein [Alicyclobacillus fastidiosus]GMA63481.1 hypothetical protein GCM10025859_39210 [Alicyclobacillus fastidiosus]